MINGVHFEDMNDLVEFNEFEASVRHSDEHPS